MRKALPILLLLAALATGAFFYFRHEPDPRVLAGTAAQWVSPETLIFLEMPDVARTLQRWEGTALHRITLEPGWADVMKKFENIDLYFSMPVGPFGKGLPLLLEAEPASAFVALGSVDETAPKLVGGFTYRGKKTVVNTALERWRAALFAGAPAAESTIVKEAGTEIEVLEGVGLSVALAFRDQWFFFSNDVELLKGLLRKYAAAEGTVASLAKDPLYMEYEKHTMPGADVIAFANVQRMRANPSPEPAGRRRNMNRWEPFIPVAARYTMKIEGPLFRDQIFVKIPALPKVEPMANRLLAFTSKDTCAYLAFNTGGFKELQAPVADHWLSHALETNLIKLEVGPAKFHEALGAEFAMLSDWKEEVMSETKFGVAEVRDGTKTRALAERIKNWAYTATMWRTAILTTNDRHVVTGPTEVTAELSQHAEKKEPSLAASTAYQEAMKKVTPPTLGMLYVDTRMMFDRVAGMLRFLGMPNATMSRAEMAERSNGVSRHLIPLAMTLAGIADGYVLDAAGPIPGVLALPSMGIGTRTNPAAPPTLPEIPGALNDPPDAK